MPENRRGILALVLGLAALGSLSFAGSRGLYESTEGRYAEVAREMMESGDYLAPTLNYQPHWTKPPMSYWMFVAGMNALGKNEWGVRLANALAFIVATALVIGIGATLWTPVTGYAAGLIYASSLYPLLAAWSVNTDTLLAMFELSAMFCFVKAVFGDGHERRNLWMGVSWMLWGGAFLTKGPPALLPLVFIAVWYLARPRRFRPVPFFPFWGTAAFLVIGLSWYIHAAATHPGLLGYWFGHEVADRIASNAFHRNSEWYRPLDIYLPVLTAGLGAWLGYFICAIRRFRLLRPRVVWQALRGNTPSGFLAAWFTGPLLVFCLVKSRMHLYVLPLFAALTLVTAREITLRFERPLSTRKLWIIACVTVGIVIVGKGVISHRPAKKDMRAVFQSCRAVSLRKPVFAFKESKLFGLQFYLDGKLKRLSSTGSEPWADATPEDALNAAGNTGMIVVASRKHARELEEILASSRAVFRKIPSAHPYWKLFVVD